MLRRAFLAVTLVSGLFVLPYGTAHANEAYVDESAKFIRELAAKAINTLSNESLSREERRDKFRSLFNDSFAVRGIALYVLGRYRKRATDEEIKEYLKLFEDVIVNTWADRFTEYSGQRFDVDGASATTSPAKDEKAVLVKSTFYTDPNSPVNIEWRVASKGNIFKIVDVKVSGLSLAKTQQDEFAQVIRDHGNKVSGLIDKLREMRGS